MEIVRALIEEAKANGKTPTEEERQILLEVELLRMLEAEPATQNMGNADTASVPDNHTPLKV
jgi:hypothetical protein